MKVKVGNVYGRLTVVEFLRIEQQEDKQNKYVWLCKCECRNECEKTNSQLLRSKKNNCGCLKSHTTHGKSNIRLYNIWQGMKRRCYGKKWRTHKTYHKNKIKMCDEWRNSFENFYEWAIRNGYQDDLSIDRINNFGNYEPANCRWADRITQENNTSRNAWIEYGNEIDTIANWARKLNITKNAMRYRISKGWGTRVLK